MSDLFGVDIAAIVDSAMSAGLLPANLVKRSAGTLTAGALTSGTTPTTSAFPCRGVVVDYTQREMAGGIVKLGDRKIILIANSIAGGQIPEPNDAIEIEGTSYRIGDQGVSRDPAAATYECRARR